jgi:TrmH family RNA methyltransferase
VLITSPHNPSVRQIRSLRSRKQRERAGRFFVEGIRVVAEAVQLGAAIETCVVAPEALTSPFARELVRTLRSQGVPCLEVTPEVFRTLSRREGPQGLGAVVRQRWEPLSSVRPAGELCWVALEGAQDPGNVGTILRTSDAVGGAGVILLGPTTDPYDPAALRASMGAVFSQRLVRANPAQFARWKGLHGYRVVGTSGTASTDYLAVAYRPPVVLLMGSERLGLSAAQQAACDVTVRIPMVGRSDSLNLAVATGVMLYEVFNQRRAAH